MRGWNTAVLALWEKVVHASLESDDSFRRSLRDSLERLGADMRQLSRLSGVSESSLYKIMSGERANPRLSTYRRIVNSLRELEGGRIPAEPFIAIIAARPTLDAVQRKYVEVAGRRVELREYAATSMEEVIVAAVRAEREGAQAIVCAPIVSTTVEKITKIPVSACPVTMCRQPIVRAAEIAAAKVFGESGPSRSA
ncbi:MAG: transcriptional regulator [Aigarchaeota archaeon]|nr:transcriptional regulator [Aigarchaeota archaeon]MDH5703936.1 transcriptional regulator [Aigarchaeota archaeon]